MECKWNNNQCTSTFINKDNGMKFTFPCDESSCKGRPFSFDIRRLFSTQNEQLPFAWIMIFIVLFILLIINVVLLMV